MFFFFENFVIDFKDPSSLFTMSMISVHHSVMWYLIIILSLVYWALVAILRDFVWTNNGRRDGATYSFLFSYIFFVFDFIYLYIFLILQYFVFQRLYYELHDLLVELRFFSVLMYKTSWLSLFNFGDLSYYYGYKQPKLSFSRIWNNLKLFYIDSALAPVSSVGYFDYNANDTTDMAFLNVRKFKHSLFFEFTWAIFPSVIILLILIPSMLLLYSLDEELDPAFSVRVVGHQWFWSYEFDNWIANEDGSFEFFTTDFDSCLVVEDYLSLGDFRLLEVDNPLIVPVNSTIRFLITSVDVIHAWAVPELGIKIDAVPGRLSQYISFIYRPGFFYGQCSELCGVAHGFMPIVVAAF